jgi:predicted small secreted protein
MRYRFPAALALLAALALGLAACGDTWRGAVKDTGENLQAVGKATDKAGQNIEEDADKAE